MVCTFAFSFYSCLKSNEGKLPKIVVETIAQSSSLNRIALNETIGKYLDDDSAKLQAAYYLISNILHQYWVDYYLVDSTDSTQFTIDLSSFSSAHELRSYLDSLETSIGLHVEVRKFVRDIDTISSKFLINNIEKAFQTKKYTWTKEISDSMFFNFVLPYRFGNEPIFNWRDTILTDYKWVFDSMNGSTDPERLIHLVNESVNGKFLNDTKLYYKENIQTYSDIKKSKKGNYQDIAYLKASIMRTFGIPATIDYIPHFSDSIGTIFFATAFTNEKTIPLLSKKEKTNYLLQSEIAKIYRRIFFTSENSLNILKPVSLLTPPFLGHYFYQDVTSDYVATNDLIFDSNCKDTLIYIAILNDKKWKAVDWSICKDKQVTFQNFGTKVPYQLTVMSKGNLVPLSLINQK